MTFNLSEKRRELKTTIIDAWFSNKYKMNKEVQEVTLHIFNTIEKQDKEFIKKLKEEYDCDGEYITLTVKELDKLVGADLI